MNEFRTRESLWKRASVAIPGLNALDGRTVAGGVPEAQGKEGEREGGRGKRAKARRRHV